MSRSDRERERERDDRGRREDDRHNRDKHRGGDREKDRERERDRGGDRDRDRDRSRTYRSRSRSPRRDDESRKRPRDESALAEQPASKKAKVEVPAPSKPVTMSAMEVLPLKEEKPLSPLEALKLQLAKQKERLEAEKKALLDQKSQEEQKKKEEEARFKAQAEIRAAMLPNKSKEPLAPSGALRVDEFGREIDAAGNVVASNIPKHTTLKINQKYLEQKEKRDSAVLKVAAPPPSAPSNPYFDPALRKVGRRKQRTFDWVEPGTYVDQGEELREELAEKAKKLEELQRGTSEHISPEEVEAAVAAAKLEKRNVLGEKAALAEWWDKPYLAQYVEIAERKKKAASSSGADGSKIPQSEESVKPQVEPGYGPLNQTPALDLSQIDATITHPVPIAPPAESTPPPPQPLPLTKKERKRLRKQAKAAKREQEQEAIILGIKEAPGPRVRLVNMVRVHGATAMTDPTQIETMVRSEMEEREQRHEQRNQERRLTPEERRAKKLKKLAADQPSNLSVVAVYRIKRVGTLNRNKIDLNARQLLLRGTLILGKDISVVIVEGGPKMLKRYQKLMTKRIDWDVRELKKKRKGPPSGEDGVTLPDGEKKEEDAMEVDEPGEEKEEDLTPNRCDLVWTGEVLQAAFNDFQVKTFKQDGLARKYLADRGVGHYWDMAKNYKTVTD